jgi:hypothetical protein
MPIMSERTALPYHKRDFNEYMIYMISKGYLMV